MPTSVTSGARSGPTQQIAAGEHLPAALLARVRIVGQAAPASDRPAAC